VSSRTYLSIGDVLTLLREEFPDVTISKIRFLESQGLVNPERSPSGYRKFFEHDVERLRWVLRQQREHFLPLKVIRDRLAEGDLGEGGAEGEPEGEHRNGKIPQPVHAVTGNGITAGAGAGASSSSISGAPGGGRAAGGRAPSGRTEEQLAKADDEAMARILADASRRAARLPEGAAESASAKGAADAPAGGVSDVPGVAGVVGAPQAARGDTPTAGPEGRGRVVKGTIGANTGPGAVAGARDASVLGGSTGRAGAPADAARSRRAGDAGTPSGLEAGAGVGTGPAAAPATGASSRSASSPGAAAGGGGKAAPSRSGSAAPGSGAAVPAARATTAMVTGASLTAAEVCSASGLSEIELAGLQGFGLIESFEVAGIPTFDEDALTVANLAAEFRAFGIEPRHLRLYRNAVDREIGLIEQVIIPLLRQRNPESRQRAVDGAEVLGTLGQTMRATLLRSALRRHIGG
jgi:DNA-binding transcriptional MerR regulator